MDLAEIYYFSFEDKNLTCTIQKTLLARMGFTEAKIEEAARENMRKDGPVLLRMGDLTDALMFGGKAPDNLLDSSFFQGDDPKIPGTEPGKGLDLFVLTNKEKLFGAVYLTDKSFRRTLLQRLRMCGDIRKENFSEESLAAIRQSRTAAVLGQKGGTSRDEEAGRTANGNKIISGQ